MQNAKCQSNAHRITQNIYIYTQHTARTNCSLLYLLTVLRSVLQLRSGRQLHAGIACNYLMAVLCKSIDRIGSAAAITFAIGHGTRGNHIPASEFRNRRLDASLWVS